MKRERVGGVHGVSALLAHAPARVTQLWLRDEAGRLEPIAARARELGLSPQFAGDAALERLGGEKHQGVVAEFHPAEPLDDHGLDACIADAADDALVLVLDQVQDPGNLGACLRTAAAAGVDCVVVPRDRAAGLTPAVRRASAGASETVPLAAVTNLSRVLERMAAAGLWRVGLAGGTGDSLYAARLTGPLVLVAGGEEKGMRRLTRRHCDVLAEIPMAGSVESLNVSVAAGIALFEARRQRLAHVAG